MEFSILESSETADYRETLKTGERSSSKETASSARHVRLYIFAGIYISIDMYTHRRTKIHWDAFCHGHKRQSHGQPGTRDVLFVY